MSASAAKSNNSTPHKRSSPSDTDRHPPKLDITKEEFERIKDALQKEEFRKLFFEYIEEIQDPENRKLYEKEIKQFEAERGVDVKFINPEPGFVIKTSVDGAVKCFINVAKCDLIEKPTSEVTVKSESGERGITWSIPLAQSPPRDDLDAQNKKCRVYDVVFHSDALHLAHRNGQFRKCLIDTALDAVEREFKVKLDRSNLKFPKMQFKGIARPTVIRNLAKNPPKEATEPHPLEHIYPDKPSADNPKPKVLPAKPLATEPEFNTPKYAFKYSRDVDLSEFTEEVGSKLNVTVPRQLVVEIELPLLKTTADCELDVTEKMIYFLSERPGAKYRLNIELPYAVNDKEGAARFDVDKRRLCITLPVKQTSLESERKMREEILHLNREDSGVESDMREDGNSTRGSPVEELSDTLDEIGSDHKDGDSPTLVTAPLAIEQMPFLSESIRYEMPPKFDCNVLDSMMALVLHVRNVEQDSIKTQQKAKSVHLQFCTVGSGFFPQHYAFYLQLPESEELEIVSVEVEAWENNVVLNLTLNGISENLQSYLAGVDASDLNDYTVQEKFKVAHDDDRENSKKIPAMPISPELNVSVDRTDEESIEITIKPHKQPDYLVNTTEDEEVIASPYSAEQAYKKNSKKPMKKKNKRRSYSESACDDFKSFEQQTEQRPVTALTSKSNKIDSFDGAMNRRPHKSTSAVAVPSNTSQQRKQRSYSESRQSLQSSSGSTLPTSFKGILKHYSRYDKRTSISDSCSSIDDYSSYSCSSRSIEAGVSSSYRFSQSFSDIPEENRTDELSESCKKTVRFSDVIKKQVFRYDSSILGQKKKNQKRRELKQRALQRRLSEGDSADYEDSKSDTFYNSKYHSDAGSRSGAIGHNVKSSNSHNNINDHGLGVTNGKPANMKANKSRARLESESSIDADATKNSMMFEMDM